MTDRIRVLVADDHPVFRSGLRALLGTDPGLSVVGEAATGLEAVATTASELPDVVLMDLNMPELDGVAATGRILQAPPRSRRARAHDVRRRRLRLRRHARRRPRLPAQGNQPGRHPACSPRGRDRGCGLRAPVAHRVLAFFAHGAAQSSANFPQLIEREREVLDLPAQADSNSRIATRLTISEKTVRNHVSNIFAKLAVADRAQAIVRARDAGVGLHPPYERCRLAWPVSVRSGELITASKSPRVALGRQVAACPAG